MQEKLFLITISSWDQRLQSQFRDCMCIFKRHDYWLHSWATYLKFTYSEKNKKFEQISYSWKVFFWKMQSQLSEFFSRVDGTTGPIPFIRFLFFFRNLSLSMRLKLYKTKNIMKITTHASTISYLIFSEIHSITKAELFQVSNFFHEPIHLHEQSFLIKFQNWRIVNKLPH